MANDKLRMAALVLVAALLLLSSQAVQSAGVAVDSQCDLTGQNDLLACLSAISSTAPTKPSRKCCSALGKTNLACLCSYKNSPLLAYLKINPKLAMQLPAKCGLRLPNRCY